MSIDIKVMKDQINALTEKFIQRMDNNPNFLSEFVQDTGAEDLMDVSFSKNFCYIEYCKYSGDERRYVTSIEHFIEQLDETEDQSSANETSNSLFNKGGFRLVPKLTKSKEDLFKAIETSEGFTTKTYYPKYDKQSNNNLCLPDSNEYNTYIALALTL